MTQEMRDAFVTVLKAATPVGKKEIRSLIKKGCTFYIIKYKDTSYLSWDIKQIAPFLLPAYHLCGDCKHCRALPTEQGGCDKVFHQRYDKQISKYPFISLGVEAYAPGKEHALFSVIRCKNFVPDPPRKRHCSATEESESSCRRPRRAVINIHWPF